MNYKKIIMISLTIIMFISIVGDVTAGLLGPELKVDPIQVNLDANMDNYTFNISYKPYTVIQITNGFGSTDTVTTDENGLAKYVYIIPDDAENIGPDGYDNGLHPGIQTRLSFMGLDANGERDDSYAWSYVYFAEGCDGTGDDALYGKNYDYGLPTVDMSKWSG